MRANIHLCHTVYFQANALYLEKARKKVDLFEARSEKYIAHSATFMIITVNGLKFIYF